jgi:hypothetical protein
MSEAPAQDQILGDYAALLRIVLPDACGFYCYSQNGTLMPGMSPPWLHSSRVKV